MNRLTTKKFIIAAGCLIGLLVLIVLIAAGAFSSDANSPQEKETPESNKSSDAGASQAAQTEAESLVLLPIQEITGSDEAAVCLSRQEESIPGDYPSDGTTNGNILHSGWDLYRQFKQTENRANCRIEYSFSAEQKTQYAGVFKETIADGDKIVTLSEVQLSASVTERKPGAVIQCKFNQLVDAEKPLEEIDWMLMGGRTKLNEIRHGWEETLREAQVSLKSSEAVTSEPYLTAPQLAQRKELLQRAVFLVPEGIRLNENGALLSGYLRELDAKATLDVIHGQDCSTTPSY